MSKVKRLIHSYSRYMQTPWRDDAAAPQRVVFCVYPETDELRLRARIDEFELATTTAGHRWALFDLTNAFPDWLAAQKYATTYFHKPHLLESILHHFQDFLRDQFQAFLQGHEADAETVIALQGVGTLFGFLKVKGVVDQFAPLVPGRLVVLFPGSYEDDNYRLLDGYDGWNYLAVPITADKE